MIGNMIKDIFKSMIEDFGFSYDEYLPYASNNIYINIGIPNREPGTITDIGLDIFSNNDVECHQYSYVKDQHAVLVTHLADPESMDKIKRFILEDDFREKFYSDKVPRQPMFPN